eukprot:NODE_1304_length_1387_cov_81.134127_g1293_i0.p1 GENE.NODE_1304_length_1387_cov_81.134127_g1293_i0~~NODE_1304_length_1387_cov_81.134127_g1293_i0.p1  ORF type:complete len:383 (+),score=101.33 NODE_1304_length_1387_cov_81.134127_g1293_i0:75-1223(+)
MYAPAPSPEPANNPAYPQQPVYAQPPPTYAQANTVQPGSVGFVPQNQQGQYDAPQYPDVMAQPQGWHNRRDNHPSFFRYMHCFACTESTMATVTFGCVVALMVILLAQNPDVACCVPRVGSGAVNADSALGGSDISCQTKFWDKFEDAKDQITGLSNHPHMCNVNTAGIDAEGDTCAAALAALNLVPASNFTDYAGCKEECQDTGNKAPKWGAVVFAFALLDALLCCWKYKAFIAVWNARSLGEEKVKEKRALILTICSVTLKIIALILGIIVGGVGGFSEYTMYSIDDDKCAVHLNKNFPNGNPDDGFELQKDAIEQLRHVKSEPIAVMAILSSVFFLLGIVLAILGFCIGRMALRKPKAKEAEMSQQAPPAQYNGQYSVQ